MRLDTIFKDVNVNQANMTIGRGHTNGIYINTLSDTFNITVRLRSKEGTKVLIPNMPVVKFGFITDYLFGAGGNGIAALASMVMQLEYDLRAANVLTNQVYTDKEIVSEMLPAATGNMYRIDFGSIYLNDGDELVIDFTAGGGKFLSVTSFSDVRSPYELITYEVVQDTNSTYHKVQSIFTEGGLNGAMLYESDVTYKVSDSFDTYLVDQVGVFTASRLLGRFESAEEITLGLLWGNSTGIPESVSVQITGTHAKETQLIVVRKEYVQAALSANTINEAKKKVERVRELEYKEPETAKALRHAGIIEGRASEMEAVIKQAELSNAIDTAK